MCRISFVSFIFLATISVVAVATATQHGTVHAVSKSKSSKAHSLGESYQFDPRDGWEHVNITDLQYKYESSNTGGAGHERSAFEKRGKKKGSKSPKKNKNKKSPAKGTGGSGIGGTIGNVIGKAWNGLKAIGDPEPVTITW